MDLNKFFGSKTVQWILISLGVLIVVFGSFAVGVRIGYDKARFSYEWGAHYERDFGKPPAGPFGFLEGPMLLNPHGALGTVTSIASSSFSVLGPDNTEKEFLVTSSTFFGEPRSPASLSSIHVGDRVIVIGAPNDQGQIQARLVRVMPQ